MATFGLVDNINICSIKRKLVPRSCRERSMDGLRTKAKIRQKFWILTDFAQLVQSVTTQFWLSKRMAVAELQWFGKNALCSSSSAGGKTFPSRYKAGVVAERIGGMAFWTNCFARMLARVRTEDDSVCQLLTTRCKKCFALFRKCVPQEGWNLQNPEEFWSPSRN